MHLEVQLPYNVGATVILVSPANKKKSAYSTELVEVERIRCLYDTKAGTGYTLTVKVSGRTTPVEANMLCPTMAQAATLISDLMVGQATGDSMLEYNEYSPQPVDPAFGNQHLLLPNELPVSQDRGDELWEDVDPDL